MTYSFLRTCITATVAAALLALFGCTALPPQLHLAADPAGFDYAGGPD